MAPPNWLQFKAKRCLRNPGRFRLQCSSLPTIFGFLTPTIPWVIPCRSCRIKDSISRACTTAMVGRLISSWMAWSILSRQSMARYNAFLLEVEGTGPRALSLPLPCSINVANRSGCGRALSPDQCLRASPNSGRARHPAGCQPFTYRRVSRRPEAHAPGRRTLDRLLDE